MEIQKFNLDDNIYIRFTKQGKGEPLLLLHTLRNRIEYSDNLLPYLIDHFTVYVIDLPGHGDSPINKACLLYTSPSPRDVEESRMPSSA